MLIADLRTGVYPWAVLSLEQGSNVSCVSRLI